MGGVIFLPASDDEPAVAFPGRIILDASVHALGHLD